MSRHCEKCCNIISDALLNLCRDNEIFFTTTETFLFKLSLKLIMSRHKKIYAQVNLCCDIKKYCRNNVFHFQFHRSLTTLSRQKEIMLRQNLAIMSRQRESMS